MKFYKMASSSTTEVMFDEEFDEILELLNEDFFQNDEISSKYLEEVTSNVEKVVEKFVCDHCAKICKSKQGLTSSRLGTPTQSIKLSLKPPMQQQPNRSFHWTPTESLLMTLLPNLLEITATLSTQDIHFKSMCYQWMRLSSLMAILKN